MCGLTGYLTFSQQYDEQVIRKMTDTLQHRGPDDQGVQVFNENEGQVAFGHRRLSILDLSAEGHQPMNFLHLDIIYNGEIYNFMEIRKELEEKGYDFISHSDTEVLLKAYHCWGHSFLDRLIGMFAIVIFDREKHTLNLYRDRAGVKPLYYQWYNDQLIFGSELKALMSYPQFHKEIDTNSLSLFLQYSYIPAPHCIFKHTYKLKPGHFLEFDLKNKTLEDHKYWDAFDSYNQPELKMTEQEAIEETEALMKSAYQYRMVADVPVGVFLSGGYDSTSVAAILQANSTDKLKTFTIGFEENEFNEAPEAKKIAEYLGTDHTEYYITPKEAAEIIPLLPDIYDEPFADNSTIPTTLLSRLARESVTVALSADGGDEIFGGYNKFNQSIKYANFAPAWVQQVMSKGMGMINPEQIPYFSSKYNFSTRYEKMRNIWESNSPHVAMKQIAQYITEKEARTFIMPDVENYHTYFDEGGKLSQDTSMLNQLLAIDYKTFLVDNNLVKVDRATMSVGLEGREPMLDHRLIELVSRLPADLKINNGTNKYLLKQIVHKYVPQSMMERPKMPFIAPLTIWFKKELKDMMAQYLDKDVIESQGLLNAESVVDLRDRYFNDEQFSHQKLWNLLVFQMWHEKWN